MVMVLISILTLFISDFIFYEVGVYNRLTDQTEVMQVTRTALQMISRDLRQIMAPDSINLASADSIRFDDINNFSISYKYLNNSVYRNGDMLINSVDQFQFGYLDANGTPLSSPVTNRSLINSISVSVTASVNGKSVHLNARIQPRTF